MYMVLVLVPSSPLTGQKKSIKKLKYTPVYCGFLTSRLNHAVLEH